MEISTAAAQPQLPHMGPGLQVLPAQGHWAWLQVRPWVYLWLCISGFVPWHFYSGNLLLSSPVNTHPYLEKRRTVGQINKLFLHGQPMDPVSPYLWLILGLGPKSFNGNKGNFWHSDKISSRPLVSLLVNLFLILFPSLEELVWTCLPHSLHTCPWTQLTDRIIQWPTPRPAGAAQGAAEPMQTRSTRCPRRAELPASISAAPLSPPGRGTRSQRIWEQSWTLSLHQAL